MGGYPKTGGFTRCGGICSRGRGMLGGRGRGGGRRGGGLEGGGGGEGDGRICEGGRFRGERGHLLERAGEAGGARAAYLAAAERTTNVPQQRYLHGRAARLAGAVEG